MKYHIPLAKMEKDFFATNNHIYELDHCSGMFVYSVDNCSPSYIKFSARIRLKVILDKGPEISCESLKDEFGSDGFCHGNESNIHQREVLQLQTKDGGEKHDVSVQKNSFLVNSFNDSLSVREDCRTDCLHKSTYDPAFNFEEDLVLSHEENESISSEEKPSDSKYSLRPKPSQESERHRVLRSKDLEARPDMSKECKTLSLLSKNDAVQQINRKRKKVGRPRKKKTTGKSLNSTISQKLNKASQNIESAHNRELEIERELLSKCRQEIESLSSAVVVGEEFENSNESENEDEDPGTKPIMKTKKQRRSKPGKLMLEKNVKCCYCNITFETKLDYFNHRRTEGGVFQCDICGTEKPFKALLMVHMLSHEPDKGYVDIEEESGTKKRRNKMKCNICGLIVSSLDSLKVHMILHTEEYPYQCCVCENQKFFSLSSLRHHQEVHNISERFQCKECGMRFSSRGEMSKHKLTHEIKCGLCGELFPNKTSRACHYRVSHPNDIKKCTECFNLFSTDEELEKHMLYHRSKKEEQCPECGVVVTRLKDHMVLHSREDGEKMFACDQCPQKYTRKAALEKHLLVHTGERPYACNLCPKRFRGQGMLRKHLFTHTQERPFVCEICGKQCSVRSNLVTHMRIHAEKRKYSCSLCCQAFNYKTSLEIHMKCKHDVQQTTASYRCVHCSQSFVNESSLTSHIMTAHPETCQEVSQDQSVLLPSGQESIYTAQDPSLLPIVYSEQSHISPNDNVDAQIIQQTSSMHTILNMDRAKPLETSNTFTIQPSSVNVNLANSFTSTGMGSLERADNMVSYFRERTSPLTHQNSVVTVPPAFHFISPTLEQLPHPTNHSNFPAASVGPRLVSKPGHMGEDHG